MSNYLKNVDFDKPLRISKNKFVHNYKELLEELEVMNNEEFKALKENIIEWIEKNYDDKKLCSSLKQINTKKKFENKIKNRIKYLEVLKNKQNFSLAIGIILILFFLITGIIVETILYSYSEDYAKEIKTLSKKLVEIKEREEETQERVRELETIIIEAKNLTSPELIVPGPRDRIKEENIVIDENVIKIFYSNTSLAKFTDTGSMLPTITHRSNAIEITPKIPEEMLIGDIISYEIDNMTVIHRIIKTGYDDQGWFAITKGDNIEFEDSKLVRFDQVQRIVIGILY